MKRDFFRNMSFEDLEIFTLILAGSRYKYKNIKIILCFPSKCKGYDLIIFLPGIETLNPFGFKISISAGGTSYGPSRLAHIPLGINDKNKQKLNNINNLTIVVISNHYEHHIQVINFTHLK